MLYLEDYLEMIEHLPQELRDRFTEMRELDLSVQNSMDSLEKKTRTFFMQCKRGELQNNAAEFEYQNLRKEYYKVLEDADEKVTIATQIHELVERYLRRLDSELFKFKCELEADNNGITEILEKRSLELDGCNASSMIGIGQKENRYFGSITSNNHGLSIGGMGMGGGMLSSHLKDNRYRPKPEKRRNSSNASLAGAAEKRQNLGNNIVVNTAGAAAVVRPLTPNLGVTHHSVIAPAATAPGAATSVAYNLQHMGGAGNAIAAAASQAIVATQQMQQGRRTASLKASYEAIHGAASGSGTHEFWINRDLSGTATSGTVLQSVDRESGSTIHGQQHSRKQKKKLSSNLTHQSANIASSLSLPSSGSSLSSLADSTCSSGDLLPASSSGSIGITILGNNPIASGSSSSNTNNSTNRNVVSVSAAVVGTPVTSDSGLVVEQTPEGEWSYDPNEPRYCTCNQVSYGDMVACDNDACPYEWFHYPCVGITQPPKGKWYCPKCTASMRRRGNRKN